MNDPRPQASFNIPCDHGSHEWCAPCDSTHYERAAATSYTPCGADLIGALCTNPAEEPGKPCCHCRVFAQMCKNSDDALDRTEDPRKTALKKGLAQLRPHEIARLIGFVENGEPVLLDRDENGHANYSAGILCPLGVAVDAERYFGHLRLSDENVATFLTNDCGFKIYNTRGIAGEFYTTNRRADLLTAAREVLAEKVAT